MASPPFNPNTGAPGDSDVVSQYPAVERTFRDTMNSWLLVDHNTQGRHNQVSLDVQSSSPSFASAVAGLWSNTLGTLFTRLANGTVQEVGIPIGGVLEWYTGTLPNGYLWADGSAVSRSTFAALYALWGTTFGPGNGVDTFNVVDKRGRIGVGNDAMGTTGAAGRMTAAIMSPNGQTLGAVGGEQYHALSIGELAVHTHGVNDSGHDHRIPGAASISGGPYPSIQANSDGPNAGKVVSAITNISILNAGNGDAHTNTQPSIICNYIIRYR